MPVIVIVGPSGSGKSTLNKMYEEHGAGRVISTTTRKPRNGEINGRDYNFVTREEFEKLIEQNEFAEYAQFNGNYYGMSKKAIQKAIDKGVNNVACCVTEIQGFLAIRECRLFKTLGIFIDVSKDTLVARLRERYKDDEKGLEERLELLDYERQNIKHFKDLDVILDNHSLEELQTYVQEHMQDYVSYKYNE